MKLFPNFTRHHLITHTNTTRPITTAAIRRVSAKPNIPSYLELSNKDGNLNIDRGQQVFKSMNYLNK